MKKGITFYIDDDVDMIAFCGKLCTQRKYTDEPIRGVTMLNLSEDDIKECSAWYVPVNGKAEPYQPKMWIPVSERKPDSNSKVLVSTRYEDWNKVVYDVDIAYYAGDNEWAADENCDRYDNTNFIVAWMPLPEPYKQEVEK